MIVTTTIDEYISKFSEDTQAILKRIRKLIKEAAPEAEEIISYGMPTFYLKGNLVHFAACKNHVGFYPAPSGLKAFQTEISKYTHSKGAVQFPYNQELPVGLIKNIVKFRVEENITKAEKRNLRICQKGHQYIKSSDCPTCPVCEKERKPNDGFLALLSAPARRALENNGISTIKALSAFSEKEILKLHGMGKASIPKLEAALKEHGLMFKVD